MAVGVDYLCLSAPSSSFGGLVEWTIYEGPAYQRGFRSSEFRWTFGGHCKRCYEPVSASSKWGTGYEHWQWGGSVLNSESLDRLAAIEGGQATRVDVRFDHYGERIDVEALEAWMYEHQPGVEVMLQRSRTGATLYVGAPDGEVRIRIYDKGAQLTAALQKQGTIGPDAEAEVRWRCELQLRGSEAARWWAWYRSDRGDAFDRAAGRLRSFGGVEVQHSWQECQAVEEDQPEVLNTLWALLQQHNGTLVAAEEAGVDVVGLARQVHRSAGRTTQWRAKKRAAELEAMGAGVVTRLVQQRITKPAT